jgi:hypothetical protein
MSDATEREEVVAPEMEDAALQPWELIDNGRYRPRRIRGSCLGRELG